MKKKRGFTLIELIIVLSIFLILASISITGIKIYKNIIRENEIESYLLKVKERLIYYKTYCYKEEQTVYFILMSNGDIKITNKNYENLEVISLSEQLKMVFGTGNGLTNTTQYYIDNSSKILQSGTMGYVDKLNRKHTITISTGDEVIRIYSPYDDQNKEEF